MTSLDDFETKLNMVSFHLQLMYSHYTLSTFLLPQALERNAILENELDEKDQLSIACQRLKDEVRGNLYLSNSVCITCWLCSAIHNNHIQYSIMLTCIYLHIFLFFHRLAVRARHSN